MVESTALLLLLTLLCVPAALVSGTLQTYQGRVIFESTNNENNEPLVNLFKVEGLATVQLGGTSPPSYFFDCNSTSGDNSGIMWSKVSGMLNSLFSIERYADRVRMNAPGLDYPDLGIYYCTDSNGIESTLALNITSSNPAISAVEQTYTTSQGLAVSLQVYVSGYPLIRGDQIHWYRPDMSEISDEDQNVQFANTRKTLVLTNVQLPDSGPYTVEVSVHLIGAVFQTVQTNIELVVYVSPVIYAQPVNSTYIIERQPFSLSCSVSGNPMSAVIWQREDGSSLPPMATTTSHVNQDVYVVNVTSTLFISEALYADMGRYRCSATNGQTALPVVSEYAEVTISPALTLSATNTDLGQTITFTDLISLSLGAQISVECLGSGTLLWTSSSGSPISSATGDNLYQVYDLTRGALTLFFKNFNENEVAVYTCSTQLVGASNVPIRKDILITNSDPAVFIPSSVLYVLQGGTFEINAAVYSSGEPVVVWYLGTQQLDVGSDSRLTVTQDNQVHRLTVTEVQSSLLGVYFVSVTFNSQTATDSINVTHLTLPTVSVSISVVTVTIGGLVHVQCQADGNGAISTQWVFESGSSLPTGVEQNGSDLLIPMATSDHGGVYTCRVSNLAGVVNRTTQIIVLYTPTSVISYNQLQSTSNQYLLAPFDHGARAPTFTCSSEGYPPPQITWRVSGGTKGFPNGVTMQGQSGSSGVQELIWQRPLEYTDSGLYECVSINDQGSSVATLELTVLFQPIINSIYPSTPVQTSPSTGTFLVPTGHTGITLTCGAFGSPSPYVEWIFSGSALPSGVVFDLTSSNGIVSAKLKWTRGFNSSDAGEYQCVVRNTNTSAPIAFENVILQETDVTTTPTVSTCNVYESTAHFQVRVLNTDCANWGDSLKESIAGAFQDEIVRIVELQCSDCVVSQSTVQTLGLPTCSSKVENGVLFRGTVAGDTISQTESVYCALSEWQQTMPLININSKLFTVDSSCSLRVDSFSSPECVLTSPMTDMLLVVAIAVPVGVVVILLVILLISCVGCYCTNRRREWEPKHRDPYSRTEARYGPHGDIVGPATDPTSSPMYASLDRSYSRSNGITRGNLPPPPEEPIHLEPRRSVSRDHLITPESTDGVRIMNTDIDCPTNNTENIGVSFVAPTSNPTATGQPMSATNPTPDYEQLDHSYKGSPSNLHGQMPRMTSFGGNSVARKFSSGGVSPSTPLSSVPGNGPSSVFNCPNPRSLTNQYPQGHVSTVSVRNFSRGSSKSQTSFGGSVNPQASVKPTPTAVEDTNNHSDCSEEPPPYTSRPPSLTPYPSMLDNSAYNEVGSPPPAATVVEQGDGRQWYLTSNSDFSLNSDRLHPSSNSQTQILPYAIVHNSDIPYTVPTEPLPSGAAENTAAVRRGTLFQITRKRTPQPYSEPVRASTGSISTQGSYSDTKDGISLQTAMV